MVFVVDDGLCLVDKMDFFFGRKWERLTLGTLEIELVIQFYSMVLNLYEFHLTLMSNNDFCSFLEL